MSRLFASALVSATLAATTISAQSLPLPVKLTAWAVNMSNLGTGANAPVEISISRWTTDAERARLETALVEQGPEKLLDALQDRPKVGFIRVPGNLGYDLRFAQQVPGEDGGTRIIMGTDRPIGFWEATNRPRTIDYPFTVIEIRLDKDGKGEGKLSVATKVSYNKSQRVVELENYTSEPVRLQRVSVDRATR